MTHTKLKKALTSNETTFKLGVLSHTFDEFCEAMTDLLIASSHTELIETSELNNLYRLRFSIKFDRISFIYISIKFGLSERRNEFIIKPDGISSVTCNGFDLNHASTLQYQFVSLKDAIIEAFKRIYNYVTLKV